MWDISKEQEGQSRWSTIWERMWHTPAFVMTHVVSGINPVPTFLTS